MTELHDLIDRLTRDRQTPIVQIHGITCLRPDPPLLTALADARTANIGQGAGTSARHERVTLNLQASELHTTIHTRVRAWAKAADVPRHWALTGGTLINWTDTGQLLRAWHTRAISDPHLDLEPFHHTINRWVHTINDLIINPPRRWTLTAPCPLCNARWVTDAEGIGTIGIDLNEKRLDHPWAIAEGEQIDALAVIEREPATLTMTICRHCEAVWPGIDGARALRIAIDERGAA